MDNAMLLACKYSTCSNW